MHQEQMDSNIKQHELYLFYNLTIAKSIYVNTAYPVFEEIKTKKQFKIDNNYVKTKCMELSSKTDEYRSSYYSFQFLTDSFELAYHSSSSVIKSRKPFTASIIRNKYHINGDINYIENKFKLIEENKKEHILISNFESKVARKILQKHNRLFECL